MIHLVINLIITEDFCLEFDRQNSEILRAGKFRNITILQAWINGVKILSSIIHVQKKKTQMSRRKKPKIYCVMGHWK